jgi:hypothetical protein
MAHIFRHKQTQDLYRISHLIKDIRFLNGGGFEGIYAQKISNGNSNEESIRYTRDDCRNKRIKFDPIEFVNNNFEIIKEIY